MGSDTSDESPSKCTSQLVLAKLRMQLHVVEKENEYRHKSQKTEYSQEIYKQTTQVRGYPKPRMVQFPHRIIFLCLRIREGLGQETLLLRQPSCFLCPTILLHSSNSKVKSGGDADRSYNQETENRIYKQSQRLLLLLAKDYFLILKTNKELL